MQHVAQGRHDSSPGVQASRHVPSIQAHQPMVVGRAASEYPATKSAGKRAIPPRGGGFTASADPRLPGGKAEAGLLLPLSWEGLQGPNCAPNHPLP